MRLIIIALFVLKFTASASCQRNNDCKTLYKCVNHECEHKSLFPMDGLEFTGTFFTIIVAALSTSAGLGGGPLNSIIGQIFFGFNISRAIPLSQVVIFGGTFMSVGLKINDKHPTTNKPLIDYQLIAYLITPLLAGTSIGVILHLLMPDWLTIVLLVVLKIYISYIAIKKYIQAYKRETEIRNAEKDKLITQIYDNTQPEKINWNIILGILVVYAVVLLGSFIKGGRGLDSILGIAQCSYVF